MLGCARSAACRRHQASAICRRLHACQAATVDTPSMLEQPTVADLGSRKTVELAGGKVEGVSVGGQVRRDAGFEAQTT